MRAVLTVGCLSVACLVGGCVVREPETAAGYAPSYASPSDTAPASAAPGVAESAGPVVGSGTLATAAADPGQSVGLTYTLAAAPGAITAITLSGFPSGQGQPVALPLPTQPDVAMTGTFTVPVPMRAGSYPLALQVATARGPGGVIPLGTFLVNRVAARLEDAVLTPAQASAATCSGGALQAQLSYTIDSANGAASVSEIRLLPSSLASRLPILPATPLDLRHPTALAPAPVSAADASGFSVRPLVAVAPVPQQVASTAAAPGRGVVLLPSQRWDVASDRVTTPVAVPCNLPAPTIWHVPIAGVVDGAQPTNQVAAQFRILP